jgi:hypothetical protein
MIKWISALLGACACVAGCASTDSSTGVPTQPSSFAPATVTETFAGTVAILGSDSHPFNVPVAGEVHITLSAVDPPDSPSLTMSIGLPSSTVLGQCATIQSVTATAATTPQIVGHALAGAFCVLLSDPTGVLTQSVNYTVVVAHP